MRSSRQWRSRCPALASDAVAGRGGLRAATAARSCHFASLSAAIVASGTRLQIRRTNSIAGVSNRLRSRNPHSGPLRCRRQRDSSGSGQAIGIRRALEFPRNCPRRSSCHATARAVAFRMCPHVTVGHEVDDDVAKTEVAIGVPVDEALRGATQDRARRRYVDIGPANDHFFVERRRAVFRVLATHGLVEVQQATARASCVEEFRDDHQRAGHSGGAASTSRFVAGKRLCPLHGLWGLFARRLSRCDWCGGLVLGRWCGHLGRCSLWFRRSGQSLGGDRGLGRCSFRDSDQQRTQQSEQGGSHIPGIARHRNERGELAAAPAFRSPARRFATGRPSKLSDVGTGDTAPFPHHWLWCLSAGLCIPCVQRALPQAFPDANGMRNHWHRTSDRALPSIAGSCLVARSRDGSNLSAFNDSNDTATWSRTAGA
jgi:hypothetical protein